MIVLAICTDSKVFLNNKIFQKNIAENYPGSLWAYEFKKIAISHNILAITGDVALDYVEKGAVNIKKVWVLQEENSSIGRELIKIGARPLAITCAESPLYARKFYKNISKYTQSFPHRILFRGSFADISENGNNHIMHFPSFSASNESNIVKWSERKFMVMVAANKYWKTRQSLPKVIFKKISNKITGLQNEITKDMISRQLLDYRLECIEFFAKENSLILFGGGWENIKNLPISWEKRLKNIVKELCPEKCKNKHQTISNYKFSLCIENYIYPGYITEKIIDCLSAGVIPLYEGAPDIEEFIPGECFINIKKYKTKIELKEKINNINEDEAMYMIRKGKEFLNSKFGEVYTHEYFAELIFKILIKESSK